LSSIERSFFHPFDKSATGQASDFFFESRTPPVAAVQAIHSETLSFIPNPAYLFHSKTKWFASALPAAVSL
jgi:hypothetical protein